MNYNKNIKLTGKQNSIINYKKHFTTSKHYEILVNTYFLILSRITILKGLSKISAICINTFCYNKRSYEITQQNKKKIVKYNFICVILSFI